MQKNKMITGKSFRSYMEMQKSYKKYLNTCASCHWGKSEQTATITATLWEIKLKHFWKTGKNLLFGTHLQCFAVVLLI